MMEAIDSIFPDPRRYGKVRFKSAKKEQGFGQLVDKRPTRDFIRSVVSCPTEVVVKVSGYTKSGASATGKGAGPVSAHINYITRHGKVQIETDKGELITGRAGVKEFCNDWKDSIDATRTSGKSRDVMHLVLSMPDRQDTEKMRSAIRDFASEIFGDRYEYAFVLHTDTENTHGHLAVRCRGFDGKQIQMKPGVAQEWREAFATSLRTHGIHAEATPRSYRGVLRKAEPQAFRHMERPKNESEKKLRIPEVRKQQMKEVLGELELLNAGKNIRQKNNAEKAKIRVKEVKEKWLQAAHKLETDKELSDKIKHFIKNMPEMKTKREVMREKMIGIGAEMVLMKKRDTHSFESGIERAAQDFER